MLIALPFDAEAFALDTASAALLISADARTLYG